MERTEVEWLYLVRQKFHYEKYRKKNVAREQVEMILSFTDEMQILSPIRRYALN